MPFMVTSLVQMCRRRTLLTLLGSAGAALRAGLGIRGRGDGPAPRLEATFYFANRAGLGPFTGAPAPEDRLSSPT